MIQCLPYIKDLCIYFPLSPAFGIDSQTKACSNSLSGGDSGGSPSDWTSVTSRNGGWVSCTL